MGLSLIVLVVGLVISIFFGDAGVTSARANMINACRTGALTTLELCKAALSSEK
jgi:hypothetical protein